jgi:hypothetical protein
MEFTKNPSRIRLSVVAEAAPQLAAANHQFISLVPPASRTSKAMPQEANDARAPPHPIPCGI